MRLHSPQCSLMTPLLKATDAGDYYDIDGPILRADICDYAEDWMSMSQGVAERQQGPDGEFNPDGRRQRHGEHRPQRAPELEPQCFSKVWFNVMDTMTPSAVVTTKAAPASMTRHMFTLDRHRPRGRSRSSSIDLPYDG